MIDDWQKEKLEANAAKLQNATEELKAAKGHAAEKLKDQVMSLVDERCRLAGLSEEEIAECDREALAVVEAEDRRNIDVAWAALERHFERPTEH
jgi:hypothetical protein